MWKQIAKYVAWGLVVVAWACFFIVLGSEAKAAGLMTPKNGAHPSLQLQDHEVDVVIQDGYAVTTIEQVFTNPHAEDLEAIYAFPVPEQAAVSEFTYWIDGRPVSGEVLAKQEARRIYEEEKAAGRETAVAEQDGYKTFTMNVYPVRALQDVRVRMSYIQAAKIDTGIGRYVYPLEDGGVDEEQLAFWTAEDEVKGRFRFDLVLRSSYPVEAVRLPAHPNATVNKTSGGDWSVHMDNGGTPSGVSPEDDIVNEDGERAAAAAQNAAPVRLNQDVVVYWRHKAGLPGNVKITPYKRAQDKTGTFMMVVTPGDDLQTIQTGRDWVFVLDKSGSMNGKWATLTDGVEKGLRKLGAQDRFRIVMFDERARELTQGYRAASPMEIQNAIDALAQVLPGHSTNLFAGLEMAFDDLDQDRSSGVVLVTDGVANTGETRKRAFLDLVETTDVRLFTLIMGNSANTPLLKNIAKASGGTAVAVSNNDDLVGQILAATSKLNHQALHNVKVRIDGVKTVDVWPKDLGSLYRGQQLVVFGHYRGDGRADVRVTAQVSGQPVEYRAQAAFPAKATLNPEIERLWAFSAIEDLMWDIDTFGQDADRKQAVVDLAVEHGLVTPYTSMVVVRDEVFAQRNIKRTNDARLTVERQAQQNRAAAPVVSAAPNTLSGSGFASNPQPDLSGGSGAGALDMWAVLPVLVLAGLAFAARRPQPKAGS